MTYLPKTVLLATIIFFVTSLSAQSQVADLDAPNILEQMQNFENQSFITERKLPDIISSNNSDLFLSSSIKNVSNVKNLPVTSFDTAFITQSDKPNEQGLKNLRERFKNVTPKKKKDPRYKPVVNIHFADNDITID